MAATIVVATTDSTTAAQDLNTDTSSAANVAATSIDSMSLASSSSSPPTPPLSSLSTPSVVAASVPAPASSAVGASSAEASKKKKKKKTILGRVWDKLTGSRSKSKTDKSKSVNGGRRSGDDDSDDSSTSDDDDQMEVNINRLVERLLSSLRPICLPVFNSPGEESNNQTKSNNNNGLFPASFALVTLVTSANSCSGFVCPPPQTMLIPSAMSEASAAATAAGGAAISLNVTVARNMRRSGASISPFPARPKLADRQRPPPPPPPRSSSSVSLKSSPSPPTASTASLRLHAKAKPPTTSSTPVAATTASTPTTSTQLTASALSARNYRHGNYRNYSDRAAVGGNNVVAASDAKTSADATITTKLSSITDRRKSAQRLRLESLAARTKRDATLAAPTTVASTLTTAPVSNLGSSTLKTGLVQAAETAVVQAAEKLPTGVDWKQFNQEVLTDAISLKMSRAWSAAVNDSDFEVALSKLNFPEAVVTALRSSFSAGTIRDSAVNSALSLTGDAVPNLAWIVIQMSKVVNQVLYKPIHASLISYLSAAPGYVGSALIMAYVLIISKL